MPESLPSSKPRPLNVRTMTSGWKLTFTLVLVAFSQLLQA